MALSDGSAKSVLMKDVVQLTLQNTRVLAHLEHVLYKTWEVQSDISFVQAGLGAGKGYNELTKGKAGSKH